MKQNAAAKGKPKPVRATTRTVVVKACCKCGGTDLLSPSLGSYSPETILIPGINEITGVKECAKCGYCGYPIEKNKKIAVKQVQRESFFKRLKAKLFKR